MSVIAAAQDGSFTLSASVCAAAGSYLLRRGSPADRRRAGQDAMVMTADDAVRGKAPITILWPTEADSDEFAARLASWLASVAMSTERAP